MKRFLSATFLFIVIFVLSGVSFGSINEFAGNWKNVDRNTRGITTLNIHVQGKNVTVRAWGKCHPKDCDWGTVKAIAYAPSVSSDLIRSATALTAEFRTNFSKTTLVIKARRNMLDVESFTHFTDGSNRTDYYAVYKFRKARAVSGITVTEDCISFNPVTARVAHIRGRWKIVDGSKWLFDFGNKKREAYRALRIIKFYKMNQSCFVGRPNPSFEYMLVSGEAPTGGIRGEDCLSFNPDTISLRRINGRWKIVDGGHWIFDFGNKKREAEMAFQIIKKYRFGYTCYVGRPHASFKYLRK